MQDVSQKEGRTVLFVSHNMGTISQLCNRAILLKSGSISSMGSTSEVVRSYMKAGVVNGKIEENTFTGTLLSHVKYIGVSINGNIGDNIYISPSSGIRIVVEGMCMQELQYFRTGITILKDGVKLFSLHDSEEPVPIKQGRFSSEFIIPEYLLRPGDYSISVYGHDNGNYRKGNDWIYGNEIIFFTVLEEWDLVNDSHNEGIINIK